MVDIFLGKIGKEFFVERLSLKNFYYDPNLNLLRPFFTLIENKKIPSAKKTPNRRQDIKKVGDFSPTFLG